MCLAIPGKVVELTNDDPPFVDAIVEFGGVRRRVSMACVPEACAGDYVMVHAGIAISRVNEQEAARMRVALEQLRLADDPTSDADSGARGSASPWHERNSP
jgi:hydrogenase expression/formation protein HypC